MVSSTTGKTEITTKDFDSPVENQWCPGCGNFGILAAVKKALVELKLEPHQLLFVSGIGQAGKFPHYLRCNLLNELHGRTLPAAAAAKMVNPRLTVIAEGGDGDGYAEGGNHFIHAVLRNVDLTYLVHDNQVYGLTKGQASPTSEKGYTTKTTPGGAFEQLNPLALALAANASFVARSFAGDVTHLSSIVKQAILHRGFSLVDILQPCVVFNHVNTSQFYKSRVYKLENEPEYNVSDRVAAFRKSLEWGEKIPIGVFYQSERAVYDDTLPAAKGVAPVDMKLDPRQIAGLIDEFC